MHDTCMMIDDLATKTSIVILIDTILLFIILCTLKSLIPDAVGSQGDLL